MSDKEVNITYETLFELLRREKGRDELQELHESFFEDVIEYLKDKTRILESSQGRMFSDEEAEKTRLQLNNVKKILRELYERREKKIISMAVNKSRTKSSLINTSVLLKEEKELYDALNGVLDAYREGILVNVLDRKSPGTGQGISLINGDNAALNAQENGSEKPKALKTEAVSAKKTRTIRFIKPIPKFVGPDLVIYGPFEEEDIARLPEDVANVLIGKSRAEALENEKEIC